MQSIMLVDDRTENLMALEAILERPGRQLIKATSGNEALRLLLKHDVAVMLLDVQMPGMDGFEVAELMRRNRKTQNIPIIFVTAINTDQKYTFKGYQLGAVDFLYKPLDPVILESKLRVFLDMDRQRRELEASLEEVRRLKLQNEQLLQAVGEAILSVDTNGRISYANPAVDLLLSAEEGNVVGRSICDLLFNNPDGIASTWLTSEIFQSCRQGEAFSSLDRFYLRNGDEMVPVELKASPLNPADMAFSGLAVLLRQRIPPALSLEEEKAIHNRRAPRKAVTMAMRVFDRTTGRNLGRLANISIDGFKLINREEISLGSRFQLSMVLPEPINGSSTVSFDAKAVWTQSGSFPGEFRTGFQIIRSSPNDQRVLEQLLDII